MTDWGQSFPADLSAVTNKVEEIELHDNDVYEVRIELDNGAWRVDIFWTDWQLEQFGASYIMDTHGGMSTNGRALEVQR